MFNGGDVIARFKQACLRSRIQPCHTAAEQFYVQLLFLEIKQIQVSDLEFAARGRP